MSTQKLALYQYRSCPFCQRVMHAVEALGLDLELRDIQREPEHHRALIDGTGRQTVPCLRIEQPSGEVEWMHESSDIIRYLEHLPSG